MFTLLTLNIQGLRALISRQTLMSWLNCFAPDIVCLQETHSISEEEFSEWFSVSNIHIQNKNKYLSISSPGTVRSSGVAILYKPEFEVLSTSRDQAGRLVTIDFCHSGYSFQVVCIYAPNTKNPAQTFFESIYQVLSIDLPIFFCGDFNTTVNPHMDRFGCNPNSPWAYNWSLTLTDLMSSANLRDAWRELHPRSLAFTWRRKDNSQKSRIDMVWMPHDLLDRVQTIEIYPFFRSDHSYVFLHFSPPAGVERGPGVWKFNTSHLRDEAFCTKIGEFWTEWQMVTANFGSLSSW